MPARSLDGIELYATVGDCESGVNWSEGTDCLEREEGREEEEGGRGADAGGMRGVK